MAYIEENDIELEYQASKIQEENGEEDTIT